MAVSFSLSQRLRLATFEENEPCNTWMEISQQLKDKTLKINASLQTTDPSKTIAFSFFAKAESCLIEGEGALEPSTLSQFEGSPRCIYLLDDNQPRLKLLPPPQCTHMQVIPLPGEPHYWGANFLIAFSLEAGKPPYQWQICAPFPSQEDISQEETLGKIATIA